MNFDLTEEQQMIVEQVAKFVANESPVERFRKLRDTERGWEPERGEPLTGGVRISGLSYPGGRGHSSVPRRHLVPLRSPAVRTL